MLSIDGVMQGPGAPKEDTSGGFKLGGWVAPHFDEVYNKELAEQLKSTDLLLGRKTYDIFSGYWPDHGDFWPGVNDVKKFVLSRKMKKATWNNSTIVRRVADIKKLKKGEGPDLQVHGSRQLCRLLFKHDLVDELWLKIHPVVLGKGKRFFDPSLTPGAFTVVKSVVTPSGVLIANYRRSGKVKTGTAGA